VDNGGGRMGNGDDASGGSGFSWILNSAGVLGALIGFGFVVSSSYDELLGTSISHSKDFYLNSAGTFPFDSIGLLFGSGFLLLALVVAALAIRYKRDWFGQKLPRVFIVLTVWLILILKIVVLDGPVHKLNTLLFRSLDSEFSYGTKTFEDKKANQLQLIIACTHAPDPTRPPCDKLSSNGYFLSRAWALVKLDLTALTTSGLVILNLILTILTCALATLTLEVKKDSYFGVAQFAAVTAIILSLVGYAANYAKLLKPVLFQPVQINFREKEGDSKAPNSDGPKTDMTLKGKAPPPLGKGPSGAGVSGYLLSESETEYSVYDPKGPQVFYIPREEIHDMVLEQPEDVLKELAKLHSQ
jgi:hypothetical protein